MVTIIVRWPEGLTQKFGMREIFFHKYVIVITWAEDIMADNSPSPRAQPEDESCLSPHHSTSIEYYYHHHIQGYGL